jgi:arabinoxylan arabinofuranohydrolase
MDKVKITFLALLCLCSKISAQITFGIPEKDFSAYLFVYFTGVGEQQESVRYGVSPDGYHYYTLNDNKPVLDSKKISATGGVRDPHILRGQDGKTFYMACTDMTAANGWDSNRAMVLLKSTDLVNWISSVVNIQSTFTGNEELKRVWAPQTIYDPKAGKYMVYFSMKYGDDSDKIYYAYANKDFTLLESEPKQLFFPKSGMACIDGDIIEKDGVYHLFFKTETGKGIEKSGIKVATTRDLTSGNWKEFPDYLQKTSEDVEGAGIFKLNHSQEYILMYDIYKKGKYQFTKSTCLEHFIVIDNEVIMDFHPRHGTVLPITVSELKGLIAKWGKPKDYPAIDTKQ